jgi:hypothetical protein
VSASKDDGAPEETSERVRAAAADALAHCPAVVEVETIPNGIQKNGEIKKVELRPVVFPNDFYVRVNQVPREQLVANARGVLVAWQNTNAAMSPPLSMPNSQRAGSVSNVFANAFGVGGPTPLVATGTPVTGAPVAAKAPTRQVSLYEVISGRYNRPEPNVSGLGEYVTPASATTPARGANGYVTVETPATPGTPRTYRP